jgi:hypothetical protein
VVLDGTAPVDDATELTARVLAVSVGIFCTGRTRTGPSRPKQLPCASLGLVRWWLHLHGAVGRNVA